MCWCEDGLITSVLSMYLLLRPHMSFHSFFDGYVLNVMFVSSSFQLVCCSCLISSFISVLSVLILSRISGVGYCLRRRTRVLILCFMFLLKLGL